MEERESWIKAGRIAAEALAYGEMLIIKDSLLVDVIEKIEKKIIDLGGNPAFPVQISLNHVAAHSCPEQDDKTLFSDQLAKLDVGVEVNGCIGDNACTVDLSGKYPALVKASKEALDEAVKLVKPGIELRVIGARIREVISSYGFAPIRNLGGHGLDKYDIHSSPMIPNFDDGNTAKLAKGMVIAVEPFATTGVGIVTETTNATVFMMREARPVRDPVTRQILEHIKKYHGLPFAKRWLQQKYPPFRVNLAIKTLSELGIIKEYAPLVEKGRGLVSQAEHTVMVDETPLILTKI